MSSDSPYTFHVVGTEGEPRHYELRDLSGRVVAKAVNGSDGLLAVVSGCDGFHTAEGVEAVMREMVAGR